MSTAAIKTHAPAAMRVLRSRKTIDKVGTMLAVRVAATAVQKQIDIERPETIMWMRIVFVAVQLAAVAVFVYLLSRVSWWLGSQGRASWALGVGVQLLERDRRRFGG